MEKHKEFIGENCQNGILNAKTSGTPRPNVPALRFPEFTREWKKSIIGELTTKVGSGVTPRGGESVYKSEGHPFVRSQNVGLGHLILDDIAYIDENTHQRQKNTELQLDDVLLNITGASIGRSALVNQQIVGGNVNQHVCIIRANKKLIPSFLCNFLLSQYGQKQIESFQAGGNRQGLNFEQIKSIKIGLPSVEEQKKIADLLLLIERRITTQTKIIEKLETLIKGIIETVISSQKPNILIKNCLECNSSTLQENQVAGNGDYPVYGATGISGYTETADVNGESILVIKDGSGVGTVKFVDGEYSYIGTLNRLIAKEGYCLKYLYFTLQGFCFEPYKTGMAIPHIYFKDYGKAKIFCPNLELQFEIAKGLSNINDKIEVEKQILLCLQQQKLYLLSQMFL